MNSIYICILVVLVLLLIYQWYVSSQDIKPKEGFVGEKPCYGGISSKNRVGDNYFFTNYMLDTLTGRKEQINEQKDQDIKTINMLQDFKDNVFKSNDKYQSDLKQFNDLNQNIDGVFATMNNEVNKNIAEANTKKNNSISLISKIADKIGKALSVGAESNLDERLKPIVKTSLENELNNTQQQMLDQNFVPLMGIAGRLSDNNTDIYQWKFLPQSGQSAPVRVDPITGEIQCLSFDGQNCDREWVSKNGNEFSKIDPNLVKPISCGKHLQGIEGTDGYNTPDHWCQKTYDHFAEQSLENIDYSSCPKGWTLIDNDKLICQAPSNYSKCPTVGEVRKFYPGECGKNVCAYFNQPNQIYNTKMKRDWAKGCNVQYPFKVNIKAINNNLIKPTKSVNDVIQNRIGNPQINSLDKFSAMKNGILVRGYRLDSNMQQGDKILDNLITTTINFRWGTGTILGIQPNGADQVFLEFLGYFRIPQGINTIKFRLGSDDGSRLLIANNGETSLSELTRQITSSTKKTMSNQDKCNWKTTNGCIFKDYIRQGNKCLVPGETNPSYTGLETYNQEGFKAWLQTLYNRNQGSNPKKGEAANVYDYWNNCKGVPGYEFLRDLNFQPVIKDEKIVPIIEMMNLQSFTTKESSNINVIEGSYIPFVLEFYENFGNAAVVLEWSLNGTAYQIVPRDAFFIDKSQCDNSFDLGILATNTSV